MDKDMGIAEYVVRHLDEAIEGEWLKVYYQPIVRSLTDGVCGLESLVRWIDPDIGFLGPDVFIDFLEKKHLIHKVDCYIVDKVCADIKKRGDAGLPVVPVSVNFSRLDFTMCDMLKVVEDTVKKYGIPRDYLHIEITESMIADDEQQMYDVINSFRAAGYEIWLDDFGSGFSSLSVLKNYEIDLLKMDMMFLNPFTERAKNILRSMIIMAKDIGIKTVAEGVETKEQLDFLKELGCGKIQGYYYGKPAPIDEMFRDLEDKGLCLESRKERVFYEAACLHVKPTDTPLEIVVDDGKSFKTLYINRAYKEQIFEDDPNLEEFDRRIYESPSPLLNRYREMADVLEKSMKPEVFYYTGKSDYMCFKGQALAECDGKYIIKGSLFNLSIDEDAVKSERLDMRLREVNSLFDVIYLMDIEKDRITPLLGGYSFFDNYEPGERKISRRYNEFLEKRVIDSEKEKFKSFTEISTIKERITATGKGHISDIFYIKQESGDYAITEIAILMVSGSEGREYLFCMRTIDTPPHRIASDEMGIDDIRNSAMILDNMLKSSSVRFFWKDNELRFKGASRAFLDYFGLSSIDEIYGKKYEDNPYHIDDDNHQKEELSIINKGTRINKAVYACIINGVYHDIVLSEMPIYDSGKIVGLIGFLIDTKELMNGRNSLARKNSTDSVTSLMNTKGFIDALIDYSKQYRDAKRDYGVIIIDNKNHGRILETYGQKTANALLKAIADVLVKEMGSTAALARTKDSVFCVLMYTDNRKKLLDIAERLKARVDDITIVEGVPVTVRANSSVVLRSDEGSTDENVYVRALMELQGFI